MKTIWVLVISHPDGEQLYAAESEAVLKDIVVCWAKENWKQEMFDEEMPKDNDELVENYFEHMWQEEHYEIDCVPVRTAEKRKQTTRRKK